MRQEGERAEGEEDQPAQESKPDPSSNASARSYGFSLVADCCRGCVVGGNPEIDNVPRNAAVINWRASLTVRRHVSPVVSPLVRTTRRSR